MTDVVVNRAGNVLTIGFLGSDTLNGQDLTLTASGGATVAGSSGPVFQTVDVKAASGTFTVGVGAGLASFVARPSATRPPRSRPT